MKFGPKIPYGKYDDLISEARSRCLYVGLCQAHHVVPLNDGGKPNGETVYLTPYEHVLAHYLYAMENPHVGDKNLYACSRMIGTEKIREWLEDPSGVRGKRGRRADPKSPPPARMIHSEAWGHLDQFS